MPTTPTAIRKQPRHPEPPTLADGFRRHATRAEVTVEGTVIPGLTVTFFRRQDGERTETVGLYTGGSRQLFVAWGYVGEPHCRYNAVRRDLGGWYPTRRGCPVLHPLREGGEVAGIEIMAGRVLVPLRFAAAGES